MNSFLNHSLISLNTAPTPKHIFLMIIEKHILMPELPDLLHVKLSKKSYPSQHQMSVHEGIKHPCRQCGYQFTSKQNTKEQYTKESSIFANNVAFNLLWKAVLPNTKEQYRKESNTLADSAAINLLQKVILPNNRGQYMRESNTLAVNAAINLLLRYILLDTGE